MWKRADVPNDELEDFHQGLVALGYEAQEFVATSHVNIPNQPGPVAREVFVNRHGAIKSFDGSSGHDWIGPALAAARLGAFGPV